MRIVGGRLRGRRLRVPPGVRPTTERLREALFAIVEVNRLRVLDLFAGSGALGIEALSRGAESALLLERDREACNVIRANLALARPWARGSLRGGDVWKELPRIEQRFHLVFADPPYGAHTLDGIHEATRALIESGDLLVLEHRFDLPPPPCPEGWSRLTVRRYGASAIVIDSPSTGD
ncbi:MAG: 16S rRNA (guanine(966)-N(2))-methyltransferase RsmD [Gemmatimonadetes bacterium]|nr:16S rRNA (guanine(966)-N(2))-methyltransferase RsmD [Gemmatimonadota bacterium]